MGPASKLPLSPLALRYLDHVRFEKRLAERTVALYAEDLKRLEQLADQQQLSLVQVHTSQVRRWAAQMHAQGRSARGIALILSGWRGFYSWLGKQGLIEGNPVVDVRAPKAAKPLPKALSVDEAVELAAFRADHPVPGLDARDAAMVELLYSSGLRVAELTGLDVRPSPEARGWIDWEGGLAHVLGKGSKRRDVPVGQAALQALQLWLEERRQLPRSDTNPALFIGRHGTRLTAQSVWQRLRQRGLQAGLTAPVHPHMLRHSFASHVLQSSGDLRAVQELLGHAQIGTTQVYTRLDFQHLAKAYDAAHPRARRQSASNDAHKLSQNLPQNQEKDDQPL